MYRPILALLLVTACESAGPQTPPAAPYEVKAPENDTPAATAEPAAPVAAPHATEPRRFPAPATQEAPPEPGKQLQPNGCFDGYRDLGCACAPPVDPGDCDCVTGHLCARSCKRDGDGVATVAVYCLDGGAP